MIRQNDFRERLHEAMESGRVNRSTLAARIGIDRSTLSQLLSPEADRLPRADTAAAIASALNVSLDWLLGLSQQAKLGADILLESVEVKLSADAPVDESLAAWYAEAVGYKIRHVPATLPDLMKTEAVLDYEYRRFAAKTADQAIAASHGPPRLCPAAGDGHRDQPVAPVPRILHARRGYLAAISRWRRGGSSSIT